MSQQKKLEQLRQQISRLQQISKRDPGQAKDRLPELLVSLQHSLDELQAIAAESPVPKRTVSIVPARDKRKRSKEARPGRGLRFRAMAEGGPVLVRIFGAGARCRWVNRSWLDFTGRSLEQLLGEGWLEAVHPEDRERCARICTEGLDSSRLFPAEYRLQRKTGEYGWVLEIGIPRFTSRGRGGGYLGTAIEITDHKQAETHLALQYAVARVLSEAETLDAAVAPILQMLCESLAWDVGELWSIDAKDGSMRLARLWASPSVDASGLQPGLRTRSLPSSSSRPSWQSGKQAWIADITADEALAREPEALQVGLHGMFRLPISVRGEVRAILRVFSRKVRAQDAAVVKFMGAIGIQLGQYLERQRSIEQVRESEARKAAILEASLDGVITIDSQGLVLEFNSSAERLFGYRREDAVGQKLLELIVPPRMREQALAHFARYQATRESEHFGKRFDAFALKSDGSEFPVEVAIAPISKGDQPLLTIYVCDASSRKKAEEAVKLYQERLRSLMADLLVVEERERRRLAIDLHDGLAQTIALMRLKVGALRLALAGKLTKSLDEIDALVDQANRTARSISFELSPPVLHDLGLEPALQWLAENIQSRYGIEVVLEDDGQPKPADERTRVILFRSIRELLINAAKHAGTRRVHVRLKREEDHLNAAIEDDGVGMEPEAAAIRGSGLFIIRERLHHVGGSMEIESAPGKGTRVLLSAPLTSERQTKVKVKA